MEVMVFLYFLIFCQISLSPQVKQSVDISNKHVMHELPHKLPYDLKLSILGNLKISRKSQNFINSQPSTQSSSQNKNFVNTSKSLLKNRNWTVLVVAFFTWTLKFVSNILSMIVASQNFHFSKQRIYLYSHSRRITLHQFWVNKLLVLDSIFTIRRNTNPKPCETKTTRQMTCFIVKPLTSLLLLIEILTYMFL